MSDICRLLYHLLNSGLHLSKFTSNLYISYWSKLYLPVIGVGGMSSKIRVAVQERHQSIIDGYRYRLDQAAIDIVHELFFADDLEPALVEEPVDVLLMAGKVPNSAADPTPQHLPTTIPHLLTLFPDMAIVVISENKDPVFVQAVRQTGVSGYIFKEDASAIKELDAIVRSIALGGSYYSHCLPEKAVNNKSVDVVLSPRQMEVLTLCSQSPHLSTKQLAEKLGIANSTARNLLSRAYSRLGVPNRLAAVAKARQLGLLP